MIWITRSHLSTILLIVVNKASFSNLDSNLSYNYKLFRFQTNFRTNFYIELGTFSNIPGRINYVHPRERKSRFIHLGIMVRYTPLSIRLYRLNLNIEVLTGLNLDHTHCVINNITCSYVHTHDHAITE